MHHEIAFHQKKNLTQYKKRPKTVLQYSVYSLLLWKPWHMFCNSSLLVRFGFCCNIARDIWQRNLRGRVLEKYSRVTAPFLYSLKKFLPEVLRCWFINFPCQPIFILLGENNVVSRNTCKSEIYTVVMLYFLHQLNYLDFALCQCLCTIQLCILHCQHPTFGKLITCLSWLLPVDGLHFHCDPGQQVENELSSRSSENAGSFCSISGEQNGKPQDCLRKINNFRFSLSMWILNHLI